MSSKHSIRNVHSAAAKEFVKKLETLAYRRSRREAFSDWTILAAAAIHNGVHFDQAIEEEYLITAKRYDATELVTMGELLALTMAGLEEELSDFLGQVYEGSLLANEGHGQFFTPFSVSLMLAEIALAGEIPQGRVVTFMEPAVGAGGMVIAACAVMRDRGFSFQQWAWFEAQDIDPLCFRMAYIQLSLIGAPATLVLGDTLAMERRRVWTTPMYVMSGVGFRLAAQRRREEAGLVEAAEPVQLVAGPQLELFEAV